MTTTETTTATFEIPLRITLTLTGDDTADMGARVALEDVLTPLAQLEGTPLVPDEDAFVQLALSVTQAGQQAFHQLGQNLENLLERHEEDA